MRVINKRYLALVVAAAMGVSACGSDGKDGADGSDGSDGPGYTPPTVDSSLVTNLEVITHTVGDGQITFEFQATNEDGLVIDGLQKAEAKFALQTEGGIALSRSGEGTHGGYGTYDATKDENPEGASLTLNEAGNYDFVMPMENVSAGDLGIVWLRVGGATDSGITRSMPLVVNKPEGIHTTTTATCQSCHVDYAASHLKHPSYTALNSDGEVDLVAGCMVCHGNISRNDDNGGYAKNTLQKIGHLNHQKFERDFQPANCYTCHAEPVNNVSFGGIGCVDCHATGTEALNSIAAYANDIDMRAIHANASGIVERQQTRITHETTTSAPYWDTAVTWPDTSTGAVCTDLKLYQVDGETQTQLNIANLYSDHTLTYAGAYIHGYDSEHETIVGRAIARGADQYVEREDGTRSICFPGLVAGYENANFSASTRVTFGLGEEDGDTAGYTGVSLTTYSDVVSTDYYDIDLSVTTPTFTDEGGYARRHAVTNDSCTTCHNSEDNYHKNGSYQQGGFDCVACHNNGQDRSAKNSAPGFGPMVHSMHWGVGNTVNDPDGETNSAAKLNADNCVACHADGIDLYAVPNQYIRAKAYHGGDTTKMASPVLANCYACHNTEQALNHMQQNGGELSAEKGAGDDGVWFTQPTAESCATCHAEGKTFGIEKFHVFER